VLRIAQLGAVALALALTLALGLAGRAAAALPVPPGGPILVITDTSNPFTQYYAEILRAEGLNEFDVEDVATVTAQTLASHDVAILGDLTPTDAQVSLLTNWVNGGGNLIAMRPDQKLGSLLGLSGGGGTLANGYLKVDTSVSPGAGIVGDTIQYHGLADQWTPAGARSIATLYSSASAPTTNPAVTVHNVGGNGGQAAAFTYDLARSVVLTRQGNPAWVGQDRTGPDSPTQQGPIRASDLFFGGIGTADWIDLAKVAIPQADEQQRLLANLIGDVTADRKPLPRFWYLPRDEKAAVVMTGDDHGNNGTSGRFDGFKAVSTPGCSVAAWQCIRGTSYIYPSTPTLTNAQASAYAAEGFEIALHVTTSCGDRDAVQLEAIISSELTEFQTAYPGLPAPVSNRTHCVIWSDWASQPKVELAHGIRFDTNYYYWPGSWVANRPGFFTGSGMPMRFGDDNGSMIDVYQAVTQMTDESDQTYPFTVNSLLDGATGSNGYYGVFTANMHTDVGESSGSDAIVASAKDHGVPVVSSKQMLTWLDGRDGSSFAGIAWAANRLSFTVNAAAGSDGLRGMLPVAANGGSITSITRNGSPVATTQQRIKGVDYAFFDAAGGSYVATYGGATGTTPGAGTSGSGASGAGSPAAGTNSPAAGGAAKGASKTASTAACLTLTSSVKRLVKGRRTLLTVTARKGGRPAARVRVDLSGAGLGVRTLRTDSKGRARFTVRPRRTGSLSLKAFGQKSPCKAPVVKVTVARKKA
jgi:hypothetical protein